MASYVRRVVQEGRFDAVLVAERPQVDSKLRLDNSRIELTKALLPHDLSYPPREIMSDELNVEFQVPFVHRLRFTKDVFGEDQDVLAGLLTSSDENPARVQFWIDQNVAAGPTTLERLKRFADSHRKCNRLAAFSLFRWRRN